MRQIVVPNLFCSIALCEKEKIGFYAGTGGGKNTARQTNDAPQTTFFRKLPLRLDKSAFVGAEEQPLVENDRTGSLFRKLLQNVLDKQNLCRTCLEGKVLLRVFAFFAAKWWVCQNG